MSERTRALCTGCGRLIHIRTDANGRQVFAAHNDKSRRHSCKKSGEPIN